MACWFTHPRTIEFDGVTHIGAVRSKTTPTRFYANPLGGLAETLAPGGHIVSEATNGEYHILHQSFSDDHNNPGYLLESGRPPIVFINEHNAHAHLSYRVGTTPGDLSTLGPERRIEFAGRVSYTQSFAIDGRIVLITRESGGDNHFSPVRYWVILHSDDWGETWSTPNRFIDYFDSSSESTRGYCLSNVVDGKIHVATSTHPAWTTRNSVWHITIDPATGEMTKRDGATIGNAYTGPTLAPEDCDPVSLVPDGAVRTWLHEVGPDGSIVFGRWPYEASNYDGGTYHHSRWTGTEWRTTDICPGSAFDEERAIGNLQHGYRGGLTVDRAGDVWVARQPDPQGPTWAIERWTRTGETWAHAETLASSDEHMLVRPQVPWGRTTGPRVVWAQVWVYTSPGLFLARPDWDGNPGSTTQRATP